MLKLVKVKTMFGFEMNFRHHQLLEIRQDKKYKNVCHIRTSIRDKEGKPMWFTVEHSAIDVINRYNETKG
jgi:hypothetical protein